MDDNFYEWWLKNNEELMEFNYPHKTLARAAWNASREKTIEEVIQWLDDILVINNLNYNDIREKFGVDKKQECLNCSKSVEREDQELCGSCLKGIAVDAGIY